jgi:hypothetical protein
VPNPQRYRFSAATSSNLKSSFFTDDEIMDLKLQVATGAVVRIALEPLLQSFVLTRFRRANRHPLRLKTL